MTDEHEDDEDDTEDEFDAAMTQAEPAELIINQPNITVFTDGTVMQVSTGGSGVTNVTIHHQWPPSPGTTTGWQLPRPSGGTHD